jgi:hypothetical protein
MNFDNLKLRPSEVGKICAGLAKPSLTENQKEKMLELANKANRTEKQEITYQELLAKNAAVPTLSAGAITYVHELVDMKVYCYDIDLDNRYVNKGISCENEAIQFLNENLFTSYSKFPEGRYENDWLISSGCDIIDRGIVRDIKCPWSKKTHPKRYEDGLDPIYEWQLRAYMMLFDCHTAYLDYVLIDTPPELMGYESESLHDMSNLRYEQRHTSIMYKRDFELENVIKKGVELARIEAKNYFETLKKRTNY